jgi:hypothetical protein
MRIKALTCLLACLGVALLGSGRVNARTIRVGPGQEATSLAAALGVATPGDRLLLAPGAHFDCATIRTDGVTIEGEGADGSTILAETMCSDRALLIIRAHDVTIRNLTLMRAWTQEGNGAGILAIGGNLTVERVRFIDNQNGILAGNRPNDALVVRDSLFLRNGACDGPCAHAIYAGRLRLLRIENTALSETRVAHHIKSRAARLEVENCTLIDGPEGTASYMIEAPNGGALLVRHTRLEKGPKSDNQLGAIVIGLEGITQPTPSIDIADNDFTNAGDYPTFFVINASTTEAVLNGNTITGQAQPLRGPGRVD